MTFFIQFVSDSMQVVNSLGQTSVPTSHSVKALFGEGGLVTVFQPTWRPRSSEYTESRGDVATDLRSHWSLRKGPSGGDGGREGER